jgi:hypothetical protein
MKRGDYVVYRNQVWRILDKLSRTKCVIVLVDGLLGSYSEVYNAQLTPLTKEVADIIRGSV